MITGTLNPKVTAIRPRAIPKARPADDSFSPKRGSSIEYRPPPMATKATNAVAWRRRPIECRARSLNRNQRRISS